MLDFMSKRYFFFAFSLCIIIPGIIAMAIWGLQFSNDFKGGSLLDAQFASGKAPEPAQVVALYHEMGIPDVQVSSSGPDVLIIKSSALDEGMLTKVLSTLN